MDSENNDKKGNLKIISIVVAIVIVVILLLSFLLTNSNSQTMTSSEWYDEIVAWSDTRPEQPDFPSLNPGDSVKITGELTNISIESINGVNRTHIEIDGIFVYVYIIEDITDSFNVGDSVTLTLNIIEGQVPDSQGNPISGETIQGYHDQIPPSSLVKNS